MSTAELGIVVTTTGVKEAVPDLANLAVQTGKTEAAVVSLAQTTATQTAAAGASVTKLSTTTAAQLGATAAQAESFGKRLEQALNIKTRAPSNDVLDFNKMSAGIDALRNKYAPLQAASAQYERTLTEIRMAQTLGAISTDEMTAALNRETIAFQRLQEQQQKLASQSGKQGVNDNRAGGAGGGATGRGMMQTNLMYQFQDIAVTTAMGMNPAMIALQQGTQLAAGMQMMGGAKEGVMGLVGALKSMFSLSSMLPIVVIGIGAAFIQWATKGKEEVKSLDDAMKQHSDTMKLLDDVYGDVAKSASDLITTGGMGFALSMFSADKSQLEKQAKDQLKIMTDALSGQGGILSTILMGGGGNMRTFEQEAKSSGYELYKDAVAEFIAGVAAGTPDLEKFNAEVDRLAEANLALATDPNAFMNLAEGIKTLAAEASTIEGKFAAFQDPINRLMVGFTDKNLSVTVLQEIIAQFLQIGRDNGLEEQARDAIVLAQELFKVLDALNQIETVQRRARELNENFRRSEATSDSGVRGYNESVEREREREDARIAARRQQTAARTDAERIAAAKAEAAAANIVKGAQRDREIAIAGEDEALKIQQEHADATRTRTQAMDDLLAKQELEMALIGKTAGEQAALREEYQRTYEYKMYALEHGIEMDQAVLDLIKETTAAYGEQVDMLNQKKLVQDLIFERSLIGLSAEEKSIAQKLRGTGLSTTGPEADYMRETSRQERAAADAQEWRDMGRATASDFMHSMSDALIEGGDDMGEALIKAIVGAAQRTLDKIIDKLINQILDAIFGVPGTGGAAGQGGGLAGVVGDVVGDVLGTNNGGGGTGGVVGAVIDGLNPFTAAAAGKNPANYAPGGYGGGALSGSSVLGLAPYEEMVAFAENAARVRNIDVGTAVKLMKHEGLQPGIWQSLVGKKQGRQETSYGAMQLLKGGGLGDAFERETGLSVSDPRTWRQNIEFGLNEAARNKSWQPWYGRGPARIGVRQGLENARPVPLSGAFGMGGGGGVDVADELTKSTKAAADAATKSASALTSVTKASTEAVSGIGEMGSVATKAASALSQFPAAPSGGGGGFFGSIAKMFGGGGGYNSAAGALISPQANAAIMSGGGGLYHNGGIVGMGGASRRFPNMIPWLTAPRFHDGNANLFASDEYPAVLQKGELVYKNKSAAIDSLMPELLASFKASVVTGEGISKFLGSIKSFGKKVETAAAYVDDGTVIRYKGSNKVNKYGELVDAKGKLVWGASDPFIDTPAGLKADPQPGGWDMGAFMRTFENAPRLHNGNIKKFGADEYPAVLRRGEPVFPSMASAQAMMGGNAFVNVHNYSGAKVTTQQTKDNKGMTIDVMVDRLVATQIDQRGTASNNAIRSKFAVTERLRPR